MSLLLRKKCQNLLDDVGLQNYHVDINETNKLLEVVGECGQVLVTIQGIRLSKMAPGPTEVSLALELFDAFLAKHTDSFKTFIKEKNKADKVSIPQTVPELIDAKVYKANYRDSWTLKFKMSTRDAVAEAHSDGNVDIPNIKTNILKPKAAPVCSALTKPEYKAILKWVKTCKVYNDAVKTKNEALKILTSCEI